MKSNGPYLKLAFFYLVILRATSGVFFRRKQNLVKKYK